MPDQLQAPPPPTRTRTARAALTLSAKLLRTASKTLVQLVTTPIVVRTLGPQLFGAWAMIQRLGVYVSVTDFRAAGITKLVLGLRQAQSDDHEKRRLLGASLVVWLAFLPLMIATSALLILLSHRLIPTDAVHVGAIRLAMAIFVLNILLARILSIPANALAAANLEYSALHLEWVLPVATGVATIAALLCGLGLPGVVLAYTIGMTLDGALRLRIARRLLPWFGFAKPRREEVRFFVGSSVWLQASSVASMGLVGADVLIVGFVGGAALGGVYAMTIYVSRVCSEMISTVFASARPGLINLCGAGDWPKIAQLRREMQRLSLGLGSLAAACIIVLNGSFVRLWVGAEMYGGETANVLQAVVLLVIVMLRNEAIVLDGFLALRGKAAATLAGAVAVVLLGLAMTRAWQLAGMSLALLIGHAIALSLALLWLSTRSGHTLRPFAGLGWRSGLSALALLGAATALRPAIAPGNWPALCLTGAAVFGLALGWTWLCTFDAETRQLVLTRARVSLGEWGRRWNR